MPWCAIIIKSQGKTLRHYLGVAQLVARYLGVVEAARSSRVTQTKPDLFELVKSLKRSGFLYAKRDYPHDKTDSPLFSLYGDSIALLSIFPNFPFAWLIVAQAKSEVNGKNDR